MKLLIVKPSIIQFNCSEEKFKDSVILFEKILKKGKDYDLVLMPGKIIDGQSVVLDSKLIYLFKLIKKYVFGNEQKLIEMGITDQDEIDEIKHRCQVEVADAIEFAEQSPMPNPATVEDGVYAP